MEGREREGPQVTVEPGPLRALLSHCMHPHQVRSRWKLRHLVIIIIIIIIITNRLI